MRSLRLILRLLISGIGAALCAGLVQYLAAETYVSWYMAHYGVVVRADLSEDYGFGILGLMISVLTFTVSFAVVGWLIWRLSRRLFANVNAEA